jgi:cytochrome P450
MTRSADDSSELYDPHSGALQSNLYDVYRRLRDGHPVYHSRHRNLWAVTRYADVSAVLHDAETFASSGVEEGQLLLPMMVFQDDPRHRELRAVVSRAFTPRRVAALEGRVRRAARALIDDFGVDGRCEFMHSFAAQLPSLVICELIGIPEQRRQAFLSYTEAMIETGPKNHPIEAPAAKIYAEFQELLARRRTDPHDDLMSALLDAQGEGELSDEEVLGFCFNLIVGGTDTTMNLIGNGAVLLAKHPDQRKLLVESPSLIPSAIEEILRFEAPTQSLPRRPIREVELHGVSIPAGCRLLVCYGAANHDDRVFEAPDRFDITLERERHLAFGIGAHHCLGAPLARLEGRIAFEELLDRFPEYELAEEPGWVTSRWARSHPQVELMLRPG